MSHYKIKIGGDQDEERLRFLCKEFGAHINIAVDANQYFNFEEAINIDKMLKKHNVSWFEDPLYSDSIYSLKKLSEKIATPICVGENYSIEGQFEDVCKFGAADIVQADIIRCGGITPVKNILAIVNQGNKRFATHLMPELSISLLALSGRPAACEFIDMMPPDIFTQSFSVRDGCMSLPTAPGTGIYINPDKLKELRFPRGII